MSSKSSYVKNFGDSYGQSLPTLADSMISILKFFGAHRIYGVGGDYAASLIKAFESHFQIIPSSNEMNAAFSACASAEINGLGVCLTTYTVGSLPCISAAALAKTEQLPVIFISGAPGESEVSQGALHHVVHSGASWRIKYDAALEAFAELGIRSERLQGSRSVDQPSIANEQFFRLIEHAFKMREPVFIEVPRDLPPSFVQAMTLPKSVNDVHGDFAILSGADLIAKEIAQRLNQAQNPMIFIGEKYRGRQEINQKLRNFFETYQIPFATSLLAKGVFDEHHALSLGCYNGVFSQTQARQFVEHQCDYILEVGTSICIQDTASAFATGTYAIDLFSNKTVLKGTTPRGDDILEVFQCLSGMKLKSHSGLNIDGFAPKMGKDDALSFHNLTSAFNILQDENESSFVYLPEVGNSFFASISLRTKASEMGRSWLSNPWYAAMGTSLPYARAVCHAIQDRKLSDIPIVITGDGGFHFQSNELIHFLRDNLFIILVYMNNGIFHLGKTGNSEIYNCSDQRFDPVKLVQSYGGRGWKCSTWSDFKKIFDGICLERKGINLIEIPTGISEAEQSREIQLLNLYIKARSGDVASLEAWKKIR